MNELSNDVNVITAQIHFLEEDLDRTMNERAFQIGKLLTHVKEEIRYGGFTEWINRNFKFSKTYGYNFMSYYNQYKDVQSTGQLPSFTKEVEIMALTSGQKTEIKNQVHIIPSTGETKAFDELTQKELREVTKQLKQVEAEKERETNEKHHYQKLLNQERSKPSQVITKEIKIEVVPDSVKRDLQQKDNQISNLNSSMNIMKSRLEVTENLQKQYERDSKEYKELKDQIGFLNKEKGDLSRQIESATALSGLSVKIDNFLKTELAPIRYSRALERLDSEVAVRNLSDIIQSVDNWVTDMRKYLPQQGRLIVEVMDYDHVS